MKTAPPASLFPQFKLPEHLSAAPWLPIPFTDPLIGPVRGRTKTVTRRPLRVQPPERFRYLEADVAPVTDGKRWAFSLIRPDGNVKEAWPPDPRPGFLCPYGGKGTILWVREAAKLRAVGGDNEPGRWEWFDLHYRADGMSGIRDFNYADIAGKAMPYKVLGGYRPPMFMPRWACRTSLLVLSTRIERLQDIDEGDASAEGMSMGPGNEITDSDDRANGRAVFVSNTLRAMFAETWNKIYGRGAWERNDWVWRVEFELLEAL